ncbi:MAG: hypothetical protein ACT4QE_07435 [Anaerolineales bacterium]
MTRRSCALGCGAWLLVMGLPLCAFILATQGELVWRRGPGNGEVDRVFLVNEPDASGLGYEAARLTGPAGTVCARTTVRYFLWRNDEGVDQNADYCQCYTTNARGALQASGACNP